MTDNVFVDTNILIDYSYNQSNLLPLLLTNSLAGELKLFINAIVIAEIYSGIRKNTKRYDETHKFLSIFSRLELTDTIAIQAGELLQEKRIQYIGDAFIAATCIVNKLQLATRNTKHFSKIPHLTLYPFND